MAHLRHVYLRPTQSDGFETWLTQYQTQYQIRRTKFDAHTWPIQVTMIQNNLMILNYSSYYV